MPCDLSSTVSASGQRVRRSRSRRSSRSASGISMRKGMISVFIAATSPPGGAGGLTRPGLEASAAVALGDEGMSEDIAAASVLVDNLPCELAVCQQFVEPVLDRFIEKNPGHAPLID